MSKWVSNATVSPVNNMTHEQIISRIEVAIGLAGPGWAGPTVGLAKTGPGQNLPGFPG